MKEGMLVAMSCGKSEDDSKRARDVRKSGIDSCWRMDGSRSMPWTTTRRRTSITKTDLKKRISEKVDKRPSRKR